MANYLATQVVNSTVSSLFDIITFNDANADLEFPPSLPDQLGQTTIVGVWAMPTVTHLPTTGMLRTTSRYARSLFFLLISPFHLVSFPQQLYIQQIQPAFEKYSLDLMIAPGDTDNTRLGTIGQMPVGIVPFSQRKNGAPYSLSLLGKRYDEATVIKAMSRWEAVHGTRPVPTIND
jgi:amidase